MKYSLPFLILTLVLAGCGGGGGASSSSSPTGPKTPVTVLRAPTAGDTWTFNVVGHQNFVGDVTGTIIETIYGDTVNFTPCQKDEVVGTLAFSSGGGESLFSDIWTVLENNTLYVIAASGNGKPVLATASTLAVPLTWGPTTNWSGGVTFADNSSYTDSLVFVRQDRVTVPAGTFDVWVMSRETHYSSGEVSTALEYWPPDLGNFVYRDVTNTFTNGAVYHFTSQLLSTNVPHPSIARSLNQRQTWGSGSPLRQFPANGPKVSGPITSSAALSRLMH